MRNLFILIRDGLTYVRVHPQLIFTILLIVIIPFAFLISGEQFLNAASMNQERILKDRIGLMHDVFLELVKAGAGEPEIIQQQIEEIATLNPDITKFRVTKENDGGVMIIAAYNETLIGTYEEETDFYKLSQVRDDESIIFEFIDDGERLWQAFRSVSDDDDTRYYIFTETSLAATDALFAARIREAYYWLFGLLGIVMLLLLRHIRLIDYSYLYREMKKANEMKDLFTNMIAHELRAPLTAIRGYASMIHENKSLSEPVREQGRRIEQSSGRLVAIVNDLLDVARIQSGNMKFEKRMTDLSDTIRSVLETLEASAREKSIALSHEGAELPIEITTDSKRLHQALTNLVSNAIKYTKEGSITVSVTNRRDRIEIRVKDTGMGIAAEDQKKLFAPFFRVASQDVSEITGTGLGMWITKQLIEMLGGSIGVESIRGVGTHIVVTLPKS